MAVLSSGERDEALAALSGWAFDEGRNGIAKSFTFADFGEAFPASAGNLAWDSDACADSEAAVFDSMGRLKYCTAKRLPIRLPTNPAISTARMRTFGFILCPMIFDSGIAGLA